MMCSSRFPLFVSVLIVAVPGPMAAAGEPAPWPWQDPKARVVPTGDLEWKPQPFAYVAGDSIRYIDYEGGKDANPGTRRTALAAPSVGPGRDGQGRSGQAASTPMSSNAA